jgi:hypothetical protein
MASPCAVVSGFLGRPRLALWARLCAMWYSADDQARLVCLHVGMYSGASASSGMTQRTRRASPYLPLPAFGPPLNDDGSISPVAPSPKPRYSTTLRRPLHPLLLSGACRNPDLCTPLPGDGSFLPLPDFWPPLKDRGSFSPVGPSPKPLYSTKLRSPLHPLIISGACCTPDLCPPLPGDGKFLPVTPSPAARLSTRLRSLSHPLLPATAGWTLVSVHDVLPSFTVSRASTTPPSSHPLHSTQPSIIVSAP